MDSLFFQDANQQFSVNMAASAYKQMIDYCTDSNPYETGGILIGRYSSDRLTANILKITPPPSNSKRSRFSFQRGTNNLKKHLDAAWDCNQYYLGEWHYHPNASSMPSNTDKNQMIALSQHKKLKCPEPILIIIGGHQDSWNMSVTVFANEREFSLLRQQ